MNDAKGGDAHTGLEWKVARQGAEEKTERETQRCGKKSPTERDSGAPSTEIRSIIREMVEEWIWSRKGEGSIAEAESFHHLLVPPAKECEKRSQLGR